MIKQNLYLLLITFSFAVFAEPYGKYDVASKKNLPLCQKEATKLYEGNIEKLDILRKENGYYVQYEIHNYENEKRLVTKVICDLETGNIVDHHPEQSQFDVIIKR